MSEDMFRVWFMENAERKPFQLSGAYLEPAEAADAAESWLRDAGTPGKSWCELRLNGDLEPHTCLYYMEDKSFGVWNTDMAKWPIFYQAGHGSMLAGNPFDEDTEEFLDPDGEEDEDFKDEDDDSGFGEEDEDSEIMDLGGTDDEEEDDSEPEEEDGEDEEDDPGDDLDDDGQDGDDDDGDELDDTDDEDDGTDEDEDGEGLEEDDEGEIEGEGDNEGEHEHETEDDMPRVKLFAKMRGPLGWRKRAESEELEQTNKFEMMIGKLDEDADKPKDQERNTLVRVVFAEDFRIEDRGLLVISVPPGTKMNYDEVNDMWTAEVDFNRKGEN